MRIEVEDRLRFNKTIRRILSIVNVERAKRSKNKLERLALLCSAIRLSPNRRKTRELEQKIKQYLDRDEPTVNELLATNDEFTKKHVQKAAIIKPFIDQNEPGVIFVSFEEQWTRLLAMDEMYQFADRYQLVTAPTWSPPHSVVNYLFPRLWPHKIVSLISNHDDLETLPRINDKYLPIELYASNWVNPDLFKPEEVDKDVDLIVVSNFGKYKRHFELFKALRLMRSNLKIALVGQPHDGRTAKDLIEEAVAYGIEKQIDVYESVSNAKLLSLLKRAKVATILSLREGSCVAVTEAMFSGIPVALLKDAEIGSATFVNEYTGRLIDRDTMASDLENMIDESQSFSSAKWVRDNGMSCHASSATLNDALQKNALTEGREWTRNISPLHWHPDPELLNLADKEMEKKERNFIQRKFGITIGND